VAALTRSYVNKFSKKKKRIDKSLQHQYLPRLKYLERQKEEQSGNWAISSFGFHASNWYRLFVRVDFSKGGDAARLTPIRLSADWNVQLYCPDNSC
jgi:hypothetical protein